MNNLHPIFKTALRGFCPVSNDLNMHLALEEAREAYEAGLAELEEEWRKDIATTNNVMSYPSVDAAIMALIHAMLKHEPYGYLAAELEVAANVAMKKIAARAYEVKLAGDAEKAAVTDYENRKTERCE